VKAAAAAAGCHPSRCSSYLIYPKTGCLARKNQGENCYSDLFEGCPSSEAGIHRRGGYIHHFEPGSRLRVYRAVPSGPRANCTFEMQMLGVPTDAVRRTLEGGTMVVNRGRVASLGPRNGCGESVALSRRIQDQMGVRKVGDKDNDKAGGKGADEGQNGSVRREYNVHGMVAGIPETRVYLKFEEF
jgi:hypothetical protein